MLSPIFWWWYIDWRDTFAIPFLVLNFLHSWEADCPLLLLDKNESVCWKMQFNFWLDARFANQIICFWTQNSMKLEQVERELTCLLTYLVTMVTLCKTKKFLWTHTITVICIGICEITKRNKVIFGLKMLVSTAPVSSKDKIKSKVVS